MVEPTGWVGLSSIEDHALGAVDGGSLRIRIHSFHQSIAQFHLEVVNRQVLISGKRNHPGAIYRLGHRDCLTGNLLGIVCIDQEIRCRSSRCPDPERGGCRSVGES